MAAAPAAAAPVAAVPEVAVPAAARPVPAAPVLRRAATLEWRTVTALLVILTALLAWQNGLGRADYTLYDAAINLNGRSAPPGIVIIAIDEASLAAIGRWPWPRAIHATLLEKLAATSPRAIGLDMILAETGVVFAGDGGHRATTASDHADAVLARSITAAAPVVLPVLMETGAVPGAMRTTLPLPQLAQAAAAMGHIHVEIDPDGIARSVFLREGPGGEPALPAAPAAPDTPPSTPPGSSPGTPPGTPPASPPGPPQTSPAAPGMWPHFALAILQAGSGGAEMPDLPGERASVSNPARDAANTRASWRRDYWMHIPFAGPPGTYTQVSYADVLLGRVPASTFTGKYVLVGATAAGLGDAYPTPVSGQSRAMPGVEINANVLDTLQRGGAIVRAAPWANALLSALTLLGLMTGLLLLAPRYGLMLVAASFALVLAGAWAGLALAGVWVAPAACLLGITLAYPLWSWRRLEAAMAYLGREFALLEAEPDLLPRTPAIPLAKSADHLEQRMRAMELAAQRLRDTRRFAADTLGSLPDAMLVADASGKILLANRSAAGHFGVAAPDALCGRYVADLFSALPVRTNRGMALSWDGLREVALEQERAAAAKAGATGDVEVAAPATAQATAPAVASEAVELTTRDGRHLLAHCARSTGSQGAILGWIVSLIDISALRAAETKRDEVLAFLSHDMRAPQSSILALLELHALDPARNSKEEVHARIENYARKTLDLSEQFLQLSRAETREYAFAATDLNGLAEEAIDEVWVAASTKQISIDAQLDGEPAPVNADHSMLTRAVVNLLTNAVKYSPDHTRITVTVALREGDFILEVKDQGYGISAQDQQRLFERYRRFSSPGQPKAAGAGLGMAFVKTVAGKHGGHLTVSSATGLGTTITLLLPPFDDGSAAGSNPDPNAA